MDLGAILLPASTAERHPAAPADTVPRTTVRIPILRVRGANTATPSTAEARLVLAAARPLMTMPTTAILMVHGRKPIMCSTNVRKPVRLAKHPVKNTQTMWTQTAMESATIAAQLFP